MRSALALLVFTAIVATVCAQTNRQTSIFTDSACGTQIGVLIESGVAVEDCLAVVCEQIASTTQYQQVACLSTADAIPASFIQVASYPSDACTGTPTAIGAYLPNTCVNIMPATNMSAFATSCASNQFAFWQATTLDGCATPAINATLTAGTCTTAEGGNFVKGTCPSSAPTAGPTSAPTSAPTAAPSAGPSKAPVKASSAVALSGAIAIVMSVVMLAL